MSKIKKTITAMFVILGLSFFIPLTTQAKSQITDASGALNSVVGPTGVAQTNVATFTGNMIQVALSAVGLVFLILMVYAGFRWLTSRGNEQQIETSKKTIIAAVSGIVVVVIAYAVTDFVTTRIVEGQDDTSSDEGIGCCIDWVRGSNPDDLTNLSANLFDPIPASRLTTYTDCKIQGEQEGGGDYHYGPEGYGNWEFRSDLTTLDQCVAYREYIEDND